MRKSCSGTDTLKMYDNIDLQAKITGIATVFLVKSMSSILAYIHTYMFRVAVLCKAYAKFRKPTKKFTSVITFSPSFATQRKAISRGKIKF